MDKSTRAPILLGNTGYYGTLAAMRSLGQAGVPIIAIGPSRISPGKYSRYTTQYLRSPPFEQTSQWAEWLLAAGRSLAGCVIYPTSDAVCYALSKYRADLSSYFQLYLPGLETMMCLLDKGQLLVHARAVGIDTPETWLPNSQQEARTLLKDISQCLIVKPRCQLAVGNYSKGTVVQRGTNALINDFDQMVAVGPHDRDFARRHPEVMLPMLQVYYPQARDKVYSLAGFCDRSGTKSAMLAAVKIMQRPRRLGIGLCFEEAPVDRTLAAKVLSLCRRVGYCGAFECEFIQVDDRYLLIDFNARFYNQLGLDIARGLDLPQLVHAAAVGQESRVDELIAACTTRKAGKPHAFCNGFQLALVTGASRSLGLMSTEEIKSWRRWQASPERIMVDATYDAHDYLPYAVDAAHQLYLSVRHPRAFLRDCRLNE